MQLACQQFDEIMELVKSASFHQLLAYHEKLYNLSERGIGPKWGRPRPWIKFGDVSALHYFPVDHTAYCLPPKAGSTNWLEMYGVGHFFVVF